MRASDGRPRPHVSDALALLVSAGMSTRAAEAALANLGSLFAIGSASRVELAAAGVPPKTAERLEAAFAIGRIAITGRARPTTVCHAQDVHALLRERCALLEQEVFWVISIDVRNQLIGEPVEVARGSVVGVQVKAPEVFRPALRVAATAVIVAHNHPSGDPTPSPEDVVLTNALRAAGKLIEIPVIDHVVVTPVRFVSMADWMVLP